MHIYLCYIAEVQKEWQQFVCQEEYSVSPNSEEKVPPSKPNVYKKSQFYFSNTITLFYFNSTRYYIPSFNKITNKFTQKYNIKKSNK